MKGIRTRDKPPVQESGDFMEFFARAFERYGGKPPLTRTTLDTAWSYAENTNEFAMYLGRAKQAELVQCFTQAYGAPHLSNNFPPLLYRSGDVGATIHGVINRDPMLIVITRPGTVDDESLPI